MTGSTEHHHGDPEIREEYDEYQVGETCVGVISDPENEHAWIWSDLIRALNP